MHQAGRAVPESVSIVGFDDTPLAAFYSPALTTVRQDWAALGRVCFAKLVSFLDGNAGNDGLPWPQPELIVRESAGPPPPYRPRMARAHRPPPQHGSEGGTE
jgi:DNA-binding LacI/PurR family transcriptional regulator